MHSVRLIATGLYTISRILSIILTLITIYAAIVLLAYNSSADTSLPIRVIEDGTFRLLFPFSNTYFLIGEYSSNYIVPYLSVMFLYGLFLWLLADVFNAFRQQKLFTQRSVLRLVRFYVTNLLLPLSFLVLTILGLDIDDVLRISLLHIIIGVFSFFMAAIFRQGLMLQDEQDLTL
jgi:hypothetical protein